MIEVVSFDIDGTLLNREFMDSVWLEEIPRLYAANHKISLKEAKQLVQREYGAVGDRKLEWYDMKYWLLKFELDINPLKILECKKVLIKLYEEVPGVLQKLSDKGFRLIIITIAPKEFVDFELKHTHIDCYFEHVFSATSDFERVKKTGDVYGKVLRALNVSARKVAHVGDHLDFDFKVPRKLGITSFYLDRSGKSKGELMIKDLRELESKLIRKHS